MSENTSHLTGRIVLAKRKKKSLNNVEKKTIKIIVIAVIITALMTGIVSFVIAKKQKNTKENGKAQSYTESSYSERKTDTASKTENKAASAKNIMIEDIIKFDSATSYPGETNGIIIVDNSTGYPYTVENRELKLDQTITIEAGKITRIPTWLYYYFKPFGQGETTVTQYGEYTVVNANGKIIYLDKNLNLYKPLTVTKFETQETEVVSYAKNNDIIAALDVVLLYEAGNPNIKVSDYEFSKQLFKNYGISETEVKVLVNTFLGKKTYNKSEANSLMREIMETLEKIGNFSHIDDNYNTDEYTDQDFINSVDGRNQVSCQGLSFDYLIMLYARETDITFSKAKKSIEKIREGNKLIYDLNRTPTLEEGESVVEFFNDAELTNFEAICILTPANLYTSSLEAWEELLFLKIEIDGKKTNYNQYITDMYTKCKKDMENTIMSGTDKYFSEFGFSKARVTSFEQNANLPDKNENIAVEKPANDALEARLTAEESTYIKNFIQNTKINMLLNNIGIKIPNRMAFVAKSNLGDDLIYLYPPKGFAYEKGAVATTTEGGV